MAEITITASSPEEAQRQALAQLGPGVAVQRTELSAVLTRANGEVIDLGVLSCSTYGPIRRWWNDRRIRRLVGRKKG